MKMATTMLVNEMLTEGYKVEHHTVIEICNTCNEKYRVSHSEAGHCLCQTCADEIGMPWTRK